MQLLNMYLSGFSQGFGRSPKTRQKHFIDKAKELRQRLPGELPKLFMDLLAPESILILKGARKRVFDLWSTFWISLDQIFYRGSLRWANRQMQLHMHKQGKSALSTSTGAYCRARKRMSMDWIKSIHQRILNKCVQSSARVLIVDGTSVQLSDTVANRDAYPQSGEQKRVVECLSSNWWGFLKLRAGCWWTLRRVRGVSMRTPFFRPWRV